HHARSVHDTALHADHPLEHAGGHQPRLRADRAGQGPDGMAGDLAPRAPQRGAADRDGHRPSVRSAAWWRGTHRKRLRGARRWPPDRQREPAARFPDRAGRRVPDRHHHRDSQFSGRRPLRLSEPDGAAPLMAVTLPRTAAAYEVTADGAAGSRAWRRFALNPAAIVGSLILLVMVSAAIAAPWVAPHDPAKQSLLRR